MNLIFDGNNLAYRMWKNGTNLTTSKGVSVSVIYGFVNSISSVCKKFKATKVVVVWDHKPVVRREIYSEYKKKRHQGKTPEEQEEYKEYIAQINKLFYDILQHLGIHQYKLDNVEADDIISELARSSTCIIVSEDKDFLQLVSSTVSVYRPIRDEFWSIQEFKDKKGLTPLQYLFTRVLEGDSSDEIPGVKGIGEKRSKALISKYDTLNGIIGNKQELMKFKTTANIFKAIEDDDIIVRNMLLMDLRLSGYYIPENWKSYVSAGKLDEPIVKRIFIQYEFFSYLKKFQEFIAPFRNLK